jgi:fumarate reductase (CoM/CoB) subunit A
VRTESTDILVIGAGLSGLRASREASLHGEVMMISRGLPALECASLTPRPSQYEMSRTLDVPVTGKERDAFVEETAEIGLGEEDPSVVRVIANQAKKEFERLESLGVRFETVEEQPVRVRGCFSRRKRCYVIHDLRELGRLLYQELKTARVRMIPGMQAVALHVGEGRFAAASAFDREGEPVLIRAKACILAAGGGAGAYLNTFVPDTAVGASIALGASAGAKLTGLAYVQLMLGTLERDLHPIRLRFVGEPQLLDRNGQNVLARRFQDPAEVEKLFQLRGEHYPFTTHDGSGGIDIEVARAADRGGCTLRTPNHQTPMAVYAHATNGGVRVDVRGMSSVTGLFACGEGAAGMHGASRLGGELLDSCLVFGTRAGHFAGAFSKEVAAPAEAEVAPFDPVRPDGLQEGEIGNYDKMLRELVTAKAGIIRRVDDLRNAIGVAELAQQVLAKRGCASRALVHSWAQTRTLGSFAEQLFRAAARLGKTHGPHYLEA